MGPIDYLYNIGNMFNLIFLPNIESKNDMTTNIAGNDGRLAMIVPII